jgi:hypothetical protein
MSHPLHIVPCSRTPREVSRFLEVSYDIYRDDPHWVAPLLVDLEKVFSADNPLFQHATMQLWIARREGRDVGRIAGVFDQNHHAVHQDHTAFFGFFECENDLRTSRGLFAAVQEWARQQGARRLLGPMNPTTNDECGLLVDGFDSPPQLMMTYNPR